MSSLSRSKPVVSRVVAGRTSLVALSLIRTLTTVPNTVLKPQQQPSVSAKSIVFEKASSTISTRSIASVVSHEPPFLPATLSLKSGHSFSATSFGAPLTESISGEVVFTTAIVGYPESMTDPSYRGQILVFTQPLVGNYGVPGNELDEFGLLSHFESDHIQVKAIVVNDYATKYSHWNAIESLGQWCARNGVVAISGVDTREVVTILRDRGSTLGQISINGSPDVTKFDDPNTRNLAAEVSTKKRVVYNKGAPVKVALIDCGVKHNIIRCLASRGVEVHLVPWDHDLLADEVKYDGVFISNGPGDPRKCDKTVANLREYIKNQPEVPIPIFGICMGNQILGLAAGFDIYKLPYGNRGHNQPALDLITGKCVITSQNHGYAVKDTVKVPGWSAYFRNANDGSNEGVRHDTLPFRSVQFHPEAQGGPLDTEYLFTDFVENVHKYKSLRGAIDANASLISEKNRVKLSQRQTSCSAQPLVIFNYDTNSYTNLLGGDSGVDGTGGYIISGGLAKWTPTVTADAYWFTDLYAATAADGAQCTNVQSTFGADATLFVTLGKTTSAAAKVTIGINIGCSSTNAFVLLGYASLGTGTVSSVFSFKIAPALSSSTDLQKIKAIVFLAENGNVPSGAALTIDNLYFGCASAAATSTTTKSSTTSTVR
ncbi:Multifunctional pyrimidine synthesis protein CAD, partial [Nowakowskiella sp. JEL0407]